ncbi:MAG: SDR family oxidoreductase [Micromonosporaceae bacterium]
MDLGLSGRVFLVTGGSRGIGFAAAHELVAEGARVVLSSRDQASADEAAARLRAQDPTDGGPGQHMEAVVAVAADNADPATPGRLIGVAMERFGGLHGALISVGGPPAGSVIESTDEAWRSAFESVFLGAVRVARVLSGELSRVNGGSGQAPGPSSQASDALTEPKGPGAPESGSIVFVLSSSVRVPIARLAISNGLRPGLAGVVKTLAEELGPEGIRVNALLPGRIDTGRVRELDRVRGDPEQIRRQQSLQIPLRRYGEPGEVGRVAAFLLSSAASYITGSMVPVDGGMIRSI